MQSLPNKKTLRTVYMELLMFAGSIGGINLKWVRMIKRSNKATEDCRQVARSFRRAERVGEDQGGPRAKASRALSGDGVGLD